MSKLDHLIAHLQPNHYDISLKLERVSRQFSGVLTLNATRTSLSAPIKLHAKELTLTNVKINDTPAVVETGINDEVTLIPEREINSTDISLRLGFEGAITDPQHGLYPSYFEHNGEKKEILATQLEPHHAREIFPCIDEPAAKATFDITLETETGITVLGNMPIKTQNETEEHLTTTFETTPKMSTYLIAFIAGELHAIKAKTKDGVEVKVWASLVQKPKDLQYALDTAVKTIEFFDGYFGVPYPLPKVDHVALPDMGGGASAAMENWGLITYREDCLISNEQTGISTKQRIAEVIVHETSHQWFGNLVTMYWWDDLWLNESFASLMQYVGLDHLFPSWNIWEDFPINETLPALRRDSNPGVQSIKTEVNHPNEIGTIFDPSIVYAKGATILRMLHVHIGDKAFQKGLQRYFKKHAYGNTTGDDLWAALDTSAHDFITPWLDQSGFPVISTELSDKTLNIKQSQFLIGETGDPKKLWPIPLHSNSADIPPMLVEKQLTTTINNPNVLINSGGYGQFIVNYDTQLRKKIISSIQNNAIQPVDRLRLLLETTLLMRTSHLSTSELVPLLQVYASEKRQPVWDIISLSISDLKRFTEDHSQAEAGLKKLTRKLTANLYESIGWEPQANESEETTKLRGNILGLALFAEHPDTIEKALRIYQGAKHNISLIDGELRSLILSAAVKYSNDSDEVVSHLLQAHQATHDSEIQEDITGGLTSTKDPKIIANLLRIMVDNEQVRSQNAVHWFIYLLRNQYGRTQTWKWLQHNWQWVEKTYGTDKSYDIFPRIAGSILSTKEQLDEYTTFFAPLLKEVSLKRAIEIGTKEISSRVRWIESDKEAVITTLSDL